VNDINRHYEGSIAGGDTGVIPLYWGGMPIHMLPSAARSEPGSASQGEQRMTARDHVFVGDVQYKGFLLEIDGVATVKVEGTNDDPRDVNAVWSCYSTQHNATTGVYVDSACRFMRVNKVSGAGTVRVNVHMRSG
jgi:hypothetical protein